MYKLQANNLRILQSVVSTLFDFYTMNKFQMKYNNNNNNNNNNNCLLISESTARDPVTRRPQRTNTPKKNKEDIQKRPRRLKEGVEV